MANESVFLTADEASTLQAAVGRIISTGIRVPDSELPVPDCKNSQEAEVIDGRADASDDASASTG